MAGISVVSAQMISAKNVAAFYESHSNNCKEPMSKIVKPMTEYSMCIFIGFVQYKFLQCVKY